MLRKKFISCILILTFFFAATYPAGYLYAGDRPVENAVARGIAYLKKVQNDDGGFPYKVGGKSDPRTTAWVIIGLSAAGEDVKKSKWKKKGGTPLDYLYKHGGQLKSTTDYARTLLALSAAGASPVYRGENLAYKIKSWQQPNGQFARIDKGEKGLINAHVWSVLALASAGIKVPNAAKARKWLLDRQNPDGSFGWAEGIQGDSDDTAAALQALIVLGEKPNSKAVKRALLYLKSCQQKDGGFSGGWAIREANACSDAWVIQGLIAAKQNYKGQTWTVNKKNAVVHLLSLQDRSGGFKWTKNSRKASVISTAYAIQALSEKPFPLKRKVVAAGKTKKVKIGLIFNKIKI
ncbi:prenyltransferase/squalene oxidase repeat-containing protein [Thermosyntropha sp.]|uniref:prenyltransferase/squalene oxidase repeat-containing protein n=1 Tax=Thermosyntropha sp. TaxID=2740820 RepID=UPI0025F96ADE|nr:prenyltransferase/squalene oxidase repeat-containing protein [Thermosyntropha sp.]MBO8159870.1 terpene cyclase/mutase family protein [Thermosyntropha sp.]